MATPDQLRDFCHENGVLKTKPESRAAIINYLILEEMVDIDEAEDIADKFLRESGYWPEPKIEDVSDETENP